MSKRIDDAIHGRLVVETDELDIIIKIEPVEDGPTPTEVIRIRPTAAQVKHMRGDGKPVGPRKLAIELGLRRALHISKVVGSTTLLTAGAAMMSGVPWTVALPAAAVIATGSAFGAGGSKALKEMNKLPGAGQVSNWKILAGIILEVIRLIRDLTRKDRK